MKVESNTILITGGASGIGFAVAERFVHAGSKVIICGRRADKLKEAQSKIPALITHVTDVADAAERMKLRDWAVSEFPQLNVLVNNAGIQRQVNMLEQEDWRKTQPEIAINLEAPIHLTRLFLPQLQKQSQAAIVNVTSGLSFVPRTAVPVYSATKAALHSFTLSLRHQLQGTSVEVIEIIPPAVDTDLGGPGLHTFGAPLKDFADATFAGIAAGKQEVAYGFAEQASQASRAGLDEIFKQMNSR